MAWFGLLDLDMTIHHMFCVVGIIVTLILDSGASNIIMGLVVAEISNPAMHSRIMLKFLGLRYTRAYEVAEFTYFITFFIGRFPLGIPIVYKSVTCNKLNYLARFISLGVMA